MRQKLSRKEIGSTRVGNWSIIEKLTVVFTSKSYWWGVRSSSDLHSLCPISSGIPLCRQQGGGSLKKGPGVVVVSATSKPLDHRDRAGMRHFHTHHELLFPISPSSTHHLQVWWLWRNCFMVSQLSNSNAGSLSPLLV